MSSKGFSCFNIESQLNEVLGLSNLIVELNIPIRTVSEANIREHWTKTHKRHKSQQFAIYKHWLAYVNKNPFPLPCKIVLTRISPRKLDSDNLQMAFKHTRDTLAGLIIPHQKAGQADSSPFINWIYDQQKGGIKEYGINIKIYHDKPSFNVDS